MPAYPTAHHRNHDNSISWRGGRQYSQRPFYVEYKSEKHPRCPVCGGQSRVRDTVKRHFRDWLGIKVWGTIRRLQCKVCKKVHRELPEVMLPYKHYQAECIEAALDKREAQCAAEGSTQYRWLVWFTWVELLMAAHLLVALKAIGDLVELARRAGETLQSMRSRGGGWLAEAYRTTVNAGYPAYTPSLHISPG